MRFRDEIADAVVDENEKQVIAAAEQQIKEVHSHKDGSEVKIRELANKEPAADSLLEAKIGTGRERLMMGCNCGAEWTVTGKRTDGSNPSGLKIEQYNPAAKAEGAKYGTTSNEQPSYGK